MLKKIGVGLAALAALLAGVLLARTLALSPPVKSGAEARPAAEPAVPVDSAGSVRRLAEAVRFRTISPEEEADFDPAPFEAFRAFLEASFPRVHAGLRRELVNEHTLLFRWDPGGGSGAGEADDAAGSPATAGTAGDPILLASHYDVVPVEAGTEAAWTVPPFAGRVADGYLWGRGTLDDKSGVMGILEAVEGLLETGFRPRRTVYLAFGHDEEIGGQRGAQAVAALLARRGVELAAVVDEGGVVIPGEAVGVDRPVALVGVAEKGFVTVGLTVEAVGGHSSMPPARTAIGRLAAAVSRVEEHPMPARLAGPPRSMLEALAPYMPVGRRLAVANLWLLGGAVEDALAGAPQTDAMLRTTTAPTLFHAGVKANVLPSRARAAVNFRVHPSDSVAGVLAHVRRVVADTGIRVARQGEFVSEPSPVSSTVSPAWKALAATIGGRFPDAVVTPYLVVGGTDARHYVPVSRDQYRFLPVAIEMDDTERIHGTDERMQVGAYVDAVRFYAAFLRRVAGPAETGGRVEPVPTDGGTTGSGPGGAG